MSGRLRVLGVLILVAVAVLAGRPAVAGGPTSVVLSEPGTGRMAALHASGSDYTELANYVDAFGTGGGSDPSQKPTQSGPLITMTWLIHDVTPWRVDRVYLGGGEVWLATQTSTEGSGDLGGQTERWQKVSDREGLLALLTKVGVNPLDPAPAASAPVAARAEAAEPAPVTAPPAAAPDADVQGWTWALVGLVAGAVLTVTGEHLWSRRRRRAEAAPSSSASEPVSA
jgi:hypothetical protein